MDECGDNDNNNSGGGGGGDERVIWTSSIWPTTIKTTATSTTPKTTTKAGTIWAPFLPTAQQPGTHASGRAGGRVIQPASQPARRQVVERRRLRESVLHYLSGALQLMLRAVSLLRLHYIHYLKQEALGR